MNTAKGLRRLRILSYPTTLATADQLIRTFPRTVLPLLQEHATLRFAMSQDKVESGDKFLNWKNRYRVGYHTYSRYGNWQIGVHETLDVCVTLVANEEDGIEEDGKCFDVDAWCRLISVVIATADTTSGHRFSNQIGFFEGVSPRGPLPLFNRFTQLHSPPALSLSFIPRLRTNPRTNIPAYIIHRQPAPLLPG